MSKSELEKLMGTVPKIRNQFEKDVEIACVEAINVSKKISGAIGDISIDEAKQHIIKSFTEKIIKGWK